MKLKQDQTAMDGDPCCEDYAALLYEDQVENYTLHHLYNDQGLEKKAWDFLENHPDGFAAET